MIKLKDLQINATVDIKLATHREVAKVLALDETLKGWGTIKVKVQPVTHPIPYWIDRKKIIGLAD